MVIKTLARSSSYMVFGLGILLIAVSKGILGETEKPNSVFEK